MSTWSSKKARDAAQTPLKAHFDTYVRELTVRGAWRDHVHNVETYVGALMQECEWNRFKDVTPESLLKWRQAQKKAPKTLNEYLVAARAFVKWAARSGFILQNPLANVETVRVQGRQKRTRRAYTPGEIQSLLAVAGERMPSYLMAVLTGLRRGELMKLRWADVRLDVESPAVLVRASISKNHREAWLPLHPDLVEALRKLRPENCKLEDLIFKGLLPRTNRFRADLKAAGIEWQDIGNGRLDKNSFRVTYGAGFAPQRAPSERVKMEIKRRLQNSRKSGAIKAKSHFLSWSRGVKGG